MSIVAATNPIADIPDEFWPALAKTCELLGGANPLDMVKVWYSESQMRANAHNKNGNAVGIFQAMPATLAGLGFPGFREVLNTPKGPQPQLTRGWQGFMKLSALEQLPWARAYYKSYYGKLTSVGNVYLATFLPAELVETPPEKLTDDFVTCAHNGRLGWAEDANTVLDENKDGKITLGELAAHAEKLFTGPRAFAIHIALATHLGTPLPSSPPAA